MILLAVIRASGQTSSTPLAIHAGGAARRPPTQPARTATWAGVPPAYCHPRSQSDPAGGAGLELVSVDVNNTFGAYGGDWVYWEAWILPYYPFIGYGSWMRSGGMWYQAAYSGGSGYDTGGAVVIIGNAGYPGRLTALWSGGDQYAFIPRGTYADPQSGARTFTIAGIRAWSARTGWVFDYVSSSADLWPATSDGVWCAFR